MMDGKSMDKEIAVIMAAGLGSRMRPLTEHTPKPLVRVFGRPMIETVIDALLARGVKEIYVVVGYLKEQFRVLLEKYPEVVLIENKDYSIKNNISSVYAAKDVLGKADCFLCEADLVITDPSIFAARLPESCYYGKMVQGYSDDWVFELRDGYISRVKKGGADTFNMVGISFFKKEDARILSEEIQKAYADEANAGLYWDEVVDRHLGRLRLRIHEVSAGQIMELDTVEELRAADEGAVRADFIGMGKEGRE